MATKMEEYKELDVATAVIKRGDKVLCARREPSKNLGGYWEFPGSKVKQDENHAEALQRELSTEMGIDLHVGAFICTTKHDYPDLRIQQHAYWANTNDEPVRSPDHDLLKWCDKDDLDHLQWAPSDFKSLEMVREAL
jgi:8-oxo-dGTP diphosphatase